MKCPYCNHTFPLTWPRYFKAPTGRHICPHCSKPAKLKFRLLTFSILVIVCFICSLPGVLLVNRWLGPAWRGLGVLPSLIVLLPLARLFDDKHKELRATEAVAPSDTAPCAECNRVFNVQDMVAHNGLHVCARCKPIFLQKLAEGAKSGSGQSK
jgi:hypothetical protein